MRMKVDPFVILGVNAEASQEEARTAYLRLARRFHPDLSGPEADSTRLRDVVEAYRQIVADSEPALTMEIVTGLDHIGTVDLGDIRRRMAEYQSAIREYTLRPDDILAKVRLTIGAARVNRLREIDPLPHSLLVIDSAPIAFTKGKSKREMEAITVWQEFLRNEKQDELAARLLEGVLQVIDNEDLRIKLASIYYGLSQGYGQGFKPAPDIRIDLLSRILRLRGDIDYIHKFLAEAYYESGNETDARRHLARAFSITPDLEGAVKISKALGFEVVRSVRQPQDPSLRPTSKFRKPKDLVRPSMLREWERAGQWNKIEPFLSPDNFSREVISRARPLLAQAATSAAAFPSDAARRGVERLLGSKTSWDVRIAAAATLGEIGDEQSLRKLGEVGQLNAAERDAVDNAITRLRARLRGESGQIVQGVPSKEAIKDVRWGRLLREGYDQENDEDYLEELSAFEKTITTAKKLDVVLGSARYLSRWLENLGQGETASWLQQFIRQEAPGSVLCDPERRRYHKIAAHSERMHKWLAELDERLRVVLPLRVDEILSKSRRQLHSVARKSLKD